MSLAAWGVCGYVLTWLLAGQLIPGYDPVTQAISETFDLGAPALPRLLMSIALVATGALLVAFGPALDRLAPGHGRAATWLAMASGVATMLVAAAPCTAACPGFGTSTMDSLHVGLAGFGYVCLIGAPIALAWRVRRAHPSMAAWSAAIGVVAGGLFLVSATFDIGMHGLVQRGYNTLADAWYVATAWSLTRASPDGPTSP